MPVKKKNEFVEKNTSDLIPYINNARTHSPEQVAQIAASIKEFGFTNPILIDDEGLIIAGHGRLAAASQLKMTKVPCIVLHGLTEAQKRAYTIADNKIALNAGWDNEILAQELGDLQNLDIDPELLGFYEAEINFYNSLYLSTPKGLVDEDEVPPAPENPKTKQGDIWQLGQHRLMCGDNTDTQQLKALTENTLIDLLITQVKGITHQRNQDTTPYEKFIKAADSVMKKGAVFYLWFTDANNVQITAAAQKSDWAIRQVLIWAKNQAKPVKNGYNVKHEPCLYGWKEGASHLWASDRKQTTVIELERANINKDVKPVELFEYQMLNNTKGMDAVLDLFGGSGTTIIAAEKHGRRAFLMELDPKYCDIIIQRWQNFTGKDAVHTTTQKTYNEI